MTDRLYYTDAYLTEFDANVIATEQVDGRAAAILDRTAFYPTSGGQPFDTGRLGDAAVVDVIDRDDGVILHVVEGEVATGPVHGRIDWARRFEHMQQHTGQHLLSAAFDRLCRRPNRELPPGIASRRPSILADRSRLLRSRRSRTRPTVSSGRTVRLRSGLPTQRRRRPCRSGRNRRGRGGCASST